jgi:hypothetical protein
MRITDMIAFAILTANLRAVRRNILKLPEMEKTMETDFQLPILSNPASAVAPNSLST